MTVGLVTAEAAEIKSGLTAGEKVVVGTTPAQPVGQHGGQRGSRALAAASRGRVSGREQVVPAMSDPLISLQDVHRVYHTAGSTSAPSTAST